MFYFIDFDFNVNEPRGRLANQRNFSQFMISSIILMLLHLSDRISQKLITRIDALQPMSIIIITILSNRYVRKGYTRSAEAVCSAKGMFMRIENP